jgi:sarcosine/dimethylglycine N-methyltransferase
VTGPSRATYDDALCPTRTAAYATACGAREFVGQESFMTRSEILALAGRAGVRPGASVLDLCCGVAGPGRLLMSELGCTYLGVDRDEDAVALARARAAGLPGRFEVGEVPPLPSGRFDVVLLLETMLAFADKPALLRQVAAALEPGGRFAFTVEAGSPLTVAEEAAMPDSRTVRPVPLDDLVAWSSHAGLEARWTQDLTSGHARVAEALACALEADRAQLDRVLGAGTVDRLVAAHRLWSRWLSSGRVRKVAVVAERTSGPRHRRDTGPRGH